MSVDALSYEVTVGKDGASRVKVAGRNGFPIRMKAGETPEEAIERFDRVRAENDATKAAGAEKKNTAAQAAAEKMADRIRHAAPNAEHGGDPRPRREIKDGPAARRRVSDADLTSTFSQLLSLPAIWYGLPVYSTLPTGEPAVGPRCEYCRDHFLRQAPQTSAEIVKLAESNSNLRGGLEKIHNLFAGVGVATTIANYAGPPVLHHAAPEPLLNSVGPLFGVPPRPHQYDPAHDHAHAATETGAPAGAQSQDPAAFPAQGAAVDPSSGQVVA